MKIVVARIKGVFHTPISTTNNAPRTKMNNASNIIAFPVQTPTAAEVPAKRYKSDYYTTKEISAHIKKVTGYNSRMVSVAAPHSLQYVKVTVRNASVDVQKVKDAVAEMNTWTMDNTDYCEGQSVSVEITDEVKTAMAAPFIPAVEAVVVPADGEGVPVVPGIVLFVDSHTVYVSDCNGNRGCIIDRFDFAAKRTYAVRAIALHVAQILAKQPAVKAA